MFVKRITEALIGMALAGLGSLVDFERHSLYLVPFLEPLCTLLFGVSSPLGFKFLSGRTGHKRSGRGSATPLPIVNYQLEMMKAVGTLRVGG